MSNSEELNSSNKQVEKDAEYRRVADGLTNVASNLGTSKDKQAYSKYAANCLSEEELSSMYRTSWLAAKIVDIPAYEMTREWRKFTMQDTELVEQLEDAEKGYDLKGVMRDALRWSALYGGSAIVMGVDGDISKPLTVDSVKQGALRYLHVIDKRDLHALPSGDEYYPGSPNFLNPEFYTIADYSSSNKYSGFKIHRSRIVKFDGIQLPKREYIHNAYWGDSMLNRVYEEVSRSDTVRKAISSLVHEANLNIFKIKDLMQIVSSQDGENMVSKRLFTSDLIKSINNAIVVDYDNEDFERKPVNFSALPDLIDKFLIAVAGAADIPVTRLLGQSPGGLNSTGESDMRNFYDSISSQQEDELRSKLHYIDRVIAKSSLGFVPDDMKFEFNPLWQISAKEQAEIESMRAQRDAIYLSEGVINPETAAEQLLSDETYQSLKEEDIEELRQTRMEREQAIAESYTNAFGENESDSNTGQEEAGG